MTDTSLPEPLNLLDYERVAAARLDPMAYDYFRGGADDEVTLHQNRAAYDRIALRYRVLVDVSSRDLSTTVLGRRHALPIITAPTAFAAMAHPEGELAVARAAAAMGVTMTLSTLASRSIEDVAAAAVAPRWFQLYVYKDREATRALVARAAAAGYEALLLTVDAPLLGRRERDVRNRFRLPDGMTAANLASAGMGGLPPEARDSGLSAYFASMLDQSLSWRDLDWLASISPLPVLVKGVARDDDALRALDHGAAGIVVSNHGGRQLDTSLPTIEALPEVAAAVAGRAAVLVDGGIRRGTDIVKALALGADAVLLGRPILWGLAAAGEDGVRRVLEMLRDELDLAMALCGCPSLASVTPDLVRRATSG